MNKVFIFFLKLLLASVAWADPVVTSSSNSLRSWTYTAEPLFGIEQVYRSSPTDHTVTRTLFGLRLIAGYEKLSGEAEYTKAEDSENFAVAPQTVKNKDDEFKLGARTTWSFKNNFLLTARAGGQATQNIVESTTNGLLTSAQKTNYNPYAGAQLTLRFARRFSVSLSSTVIFKEIGDLSKNNYQNSISFGIGTY